MKQTHIFAASLILSILLMSCSHHPSVSDRDPASATTAKFVPGNDYLPTVTTLLNSAKSSIDIVQFNFGATSGLAEVLVAIKEKHKNDSNFRIQVIVEKDGFGADKSNAKSLDALKAAGFAANPSKETNYAYFQTVGKSDKNGNTGITHTKLVVVDGQKILAGSTNWTTTSMTKNNETDLLIDSTKFGAELGQYMETIKKKSGEMDASTTTEGNITLYTDSAYYDELISFLGSVRSGDQLDCSMYFFNVGDTTAPKNLARADGIEAAIAQAQKSGATVRLMLESSNIAFSRAIVAGNEKAVAALKKDGVTGVWWDNPSKISHMKFCVITRSTNKFDILMGSTNWNYLDTDLNHQLNWKISGDSGAIAKPLLQYYNSALKEAGVKKAL